ncbi:MAG: UvrD-helicase domain-containing protein [Synergistaceae bacterium]|nr:UvrD-helicase domain-containing protein [Synergistaceae bacterium]
MNDGLSDILPEGTPAGQERAVTCDDELITVGAGAGTGKTWVLSARFARLLFSDRESLPQNILTLTFTEAAAREMQDRIKNRVFDLIARRPKEERLRWQPVKDGFDETWISTIHSFASRLIRESGLSLDIDPRSGVAGAPQEEVFWGALESALENLDFVPLVPWGSGDAVLRETAALLEHDRTLLAALEKWGAFTLRNLAQKATELHGSLGHSWRTLLLWAQEAEEAGNAPDAQTRKTSEAVLELLQPRWAEAWRLWRTIFTELGGDIFDARSKALAKTEAKRPSPVISLAELLESWGELLSRTEEPEVDVQRAFYFELCSRLSGDRSKLFKAIGERLGQTSSQWRDAQSSCSSLSDFPLGAPLSGPEQLLRESLLRLCAFAWGAWDETKRRRGLLSFSDMIRFAAESIFKDPRTKGFKHVLIDEFQDTDPQQDAMIRALREKEGAKLFLVGDPKQAIYRFRHADLTLFADYVLQSRASGSDVTLDVSFRTRVALMERINSLFAHIWRDGLGVGKRMESLKFAPLSVPESPQRDLATVPPFTLLLSVRKGQKDKARERLNETLAQTFARWVEEGRTVWDKDQCCLRPARWKDFAILTPTRGEYELLEDAFEKEGIPVVLEKNMSYFSRGEVLDVVNTLRTVAFPEDETALAGWLASPFSGESQREVQGCLQTCSSGLSLRQAMEERLPDTVERVARLRHLGSLRGPSAVLSHLLEDRRWLACFDAFRRLRVVGNVNRAITLARQYESGVSPSLAGCAQWLDTALRADRAIEEPEWLDENADAVHVMTVHASKGLEFPVVAVVRTDRGILANSPVTLDTSKTMGVAFSDIPDMMKQGESTEKGETAEEVKAYSLKWERALSAQSELEESTRLFYVAATRARDALILCGVLSEDSKGHRSVKADSWLSWTLDWLAEERSDQVEDWRDLEGPPLLFAEENQEENQSMVLLSFPTFPNKIRVDVDKVEKDKVEKIEKVNKNAAQSLALPLPNAETALSRLSATSFALFEWCPFGWRMRHRQGLDLRWEIPDGLDDKTGGSKLGSLAHWILARWDMRTETLGEWLDNETLARRLPTALRDVWRNTGNKEALRKWLFNFSCSDEGRLLAAAEEAGELRRENPFSVLLEKLGNRTEGLTRLPGSFLTGRLPMLEAASEERKTGLLGGFPGVRLVGATDVLWQERGQWHVRDYKITLSNNAPVELYRAQLAFYALAIRLLAEGQGLPFDGVDVGLIFLREGGRLGDTRNFSKEGDWATMGDQVITAARVAAQGPWVPRREHCRRCPWRSKCLK